MDYLSQHPALLLWAFPLLLPALPWVLKKVEHAALMRLLKTGDAADQALLKAITSAFVTWAEAKCAGQAGEDKFKAVDAMLAKALPFLSADQRKQLIEGAVKALDEQAHQDLP